MNATLATEATEVTDRALRVYHKLDVPWLTLEDGNGKDIAALGGVLFDLAALVGRLVNRIDELEGRVVGEALGERIAALEHVK